MSRLLGVALGGILIAGSVPAMADAVSDFYQGRQIRFIVRTPPGGDYDQYTRLLARFMGKHIPGNPALITINMPGGGGITAANYMAQIAPRDGTVIGIVSQGLAADQALGISPGLKADLREFNWIANVVYSNQLLVVWHTSPTKTLEDAKKRATLIGTTGAGSASSRGAGTSSGSIRGSGDDMEPNSSTLTARPPAETRAVRRDRYAAPRRGRTNSVPRMTRCNGEGSSCADGNHWRIVAD